MIYTPITGVDRLLLQHRATFRHLVSTRRRYLTLGTPQARRTLRTAQLRYAHLVAAYLDAE